MWHQRSASRSWNQVILVKKEKYNHSVSDAWNHEILPYNRSAVNSYIKSHLEKLNVCTSFNIECVEIYTYLATSKWKGNLREGNGWTKQGRRDPNPETRWKRISKKRKNRYHNVTAAFKTSKWKKWIAIHTYQGQQQRERGWWKMEGRMTGKKDATREQRRRQHKGIQWEQSFFLTR